MLHTLSIDNKIPNIHYESLIVINKEKMCIELCVFAYKATKKKLKVFKIFFSPKDLFLITCVINIRHNNVDENE